MKDLWTILRFAVATLLARDIGRPVLNAPERTFWVLGMVLMLAYGFASYLYISEGADYNFAPYMLPYYGLVLLAILLAGFLPRLWQKDKTESAFYFPSLFLGFQIVVVVVEALAWMTLTRLAPSAEPDSDIWRIFVYLFQGAFFYRALLMCYPVVTGRRQVQLFTCMVFFMLAAYYLPYRFGSPYFFQEEYEEGPRSASFNAEETFGRQSGLVEAALAPVLQSARGKVDFYSVSLGSDGSQDVFRKEALAAQKSFDVNLRTAGRSVVLVNSPSTVETAPLASLTNLRQVLDGLTKKMQKDEDVLILYLTSHGGQSANLTTYLPGVGMKPITAAALDGVLKEEGFRWKVIIVSACYSGTFIPVLQSRTTLLLTAASDKTTSFGCSAESDMTYFGQALLLDVLPKARNFSQAYTLTAEAIKAREKSENLAASNPQLSFGSTIRKYLDYNPPFPKKR